MVLFERVVHRLMAETSSLLSALGDGYTTLTMKKSARHLKPNILVPADQIKSG